MIIFNVTILLAIFCVVSATALSRSQNALECNPKTCRLPTCRCSGTDIPGGLLPRQTPQFVMLTFDDAVTGLNMEYYRQALNKRFNRDGCPVSATFYISHEYTDYSKVHELYKAGHEIALHSISHASNTTYWKNLNASELADEFEGLRSIMNHFAHVPRERVQGIRLPFLQMSGDASFEMLYRNSFLYDSSWPSQLYSGLWPYTLNYKSTQDCVIGPCPNQTWPNVWVAPMLTWRDQLGYPCAMVDTCVNIPDTRDELVQFMIKNFNRTYLGNRAPTGFYVHAAWFDQNPIHFEAYVKFINYLQTLDDVFLVGTRDVINWIKNPIPYTAMNSTEWSQCNSFLLNTTCAPKTCKLFRGNQERYLTSCVDECPREYPWLRNPNGE